VLSYDVQPLLARWPAGAVQGPSSFQSVIEAHWEEEPHGGQMQDREEKVSAVGAPALTGVLDSRTYSITVW
jgi:hypothetical protein